MTATKLAPATGRCKWLETRWFSSPVLRVTADTKAGPVTDLYAVDETSTGFVMTKLTADAKFAEAKVYYVTTTWGDGWHCDCPDAANRPERQGACKHVRALRVALPTMPK